MIKAVTGRLYTDADDDANTNNNNTTRRTEHDCIGSLPNEPKTVLLKCYSHWAIAFDIAILPISSDVEIAIAIAQWERRRVMYYILSVA